MSDAADIPWALQSLTEYQVPAMPGRVVARHWWDGLVRILRPAENNASPDLAADLHQFSTPWLNRLCPPPQLAPAVSALSAQVEQALDAGGRQARLIILVGQPFCWQGDILTRWAERNERPLWNPLQRLRDPAAAEQQGHAVWTEAGVRGIAHLERMIWRTPDGLNALRALLTQLETAAPGVIVIGCESWAWAWLRRVLGWPPHTVLTWGAVDGANAARWLADAGGRRSRIFKDVASQQPILVAPSVEDAPPDSALQRIASRARGNFGVLWALWRERLRTGADHVPDPEQEDVLDAEQDADVVWVAPLPLAPETPRDTGGQLGIVLHTVLVHSRLSEAELRELLPLDPATLRNALQQWQACGFLVQQEGEWQARALSYPDARQWLRSRNYLVDDF